MNSSILAVALVGSSFAIPAPLHAQAEELGAAKPQQKPQQNAQQQGAQDKQKAKRVVKPAKIRAMRLLAGARGKAPSQAELKARHAKKLAEPWVKNAKWVTAYGEARARAKESGKLIFAYFTRSYAP